MYRNTNDGQTSIYDLSSAFGGHLKEDNRWVQLRFMVTGTTAERLLMTQTIQRKIVDQARTTLSLVILQDLNPLKKIRRSNLIILAE